MNRYGTLTRGGPSKAAASTLCQKCLKRDSYECKIVAEDRPYVSRPSRTQQLLNPKLLPKLASDVPQDLLRKKGVADEELAKIKQERGRKREQQEEATESTKKRNRSRSVSPCSSASVATISTNASRSPRISRETLPQPDHMLSSKAHMETPERKRRRSISSDDRFPSDLETNRVAHDLASARSIRRKIGGHSPLTRGRRRSRTNSRSRQTSSSSSTGSPQRMKPTRGTERRPQLVMESTTDSYRTGPESRPNQRDNPKLKAGRQDSSDRSSSPSQKSRQKRIWSPQIEEGQRKAVNSSSMRRPRGRSFSNENLGRQRYSDVDNRYGTSVNAIERIAGRATPDTKPFGASPKERSLSPFSKRLALTQAISAGR